MGRKSVVNRVWRACAFGVVVALLATACGSNGGSASTLLSSRSVEERTEQIISSLGSEDVAEVALLTSMERGYSSRQILEAVDAATLGRDGRVRDQAPDGPALGLVDISSVPAARRVQRQESPTHARIQEKQLTPIEELRGGSGRFTVGENTIAWILQRLSVGDDPEAIINVLILGPTDPSEGEDFESFRSDDRALGLPPPPSAVPVPTADIPPDTPTGESAAGSSESDPQQADTSEPLPPIGERVPQGSLTADIEFDHYEPDAQPVSEVIEVTNGPGGLQVTSEVTWTESRIDCDVVSTSTFVSTGTESESFSGVVLTGTRSFTRQKCNGETVTTDSEARLVLGLSPDRDQLQGSTTYGQVNILIGPPAP